MSESRLPFDLRPLRYVLAARDERSFSRAAQRLGIRVSTISRSVRDFEDEIGVSLFERRTYGVRLTEAGNRLMREIVPALRMVEAAINHATAAGRAEEGTIRIGIITTLAGGFLRELIAAFRQNFDGVSVEIRDGGRRDHLLAIHACDLDVAFLTGNAPLTDCDVMELWQERVHVAMAEDHPLAQHCRLDWSDLRTERFIVPAADPGPEVHDYIIRRLSDYSTYPDVGYRKVMPETLMHFVSIGEGITAVSEGWTWTNWPGLVFRPLTAPEDIVPLSLVSSPRNDNPAMRRFISFAKILAAKSRQQKGVGD